MTVEVTEADREFAARLEGYDDGESGFKRYLAGDFDNCVGVQMAARFRWNAEYTVREECAKAVESIIQPGTHLVQEVQIIGRALDAIRAGSTGDKG